MEPLGWTSPSPKKGSMDKTPQNQLKNIPGSNGGGGGGGWQRLYKVRTREQWM